MQPRPVTERITTTPAGEEITGLSHVPLGGGTLLVFTASGAVYRLDESAGSLVPISSGLESATIRTISYQDDVLLLDGGYVKRLDESWTVRLAYDAGDGPGGYLLNNLSLDADGVISLHAGGVTRAAEKVATPAWGSGYTLPPVRVEAMLGAVGSPTGEVTATVRAVSDDTVLASEVLAQADELPTTGSALFSVSFSSVTAEMSPGTEYFVSIEYSGGDSSNYITVDYHTVASGGGGHTYSGSWTVDSTKSVMVALSPGLPPKGSFGAVWNGRPWICGHPDYPGRIFYGNLSVLDWSTPNGGGYIGAIDDSAVSYEIGAVATLYGALYLIGSPSQPYLARITGDSPANYAQELILQRVGAITDGVINTGNDLWFTDGSRVWSLSGVQQYGDLRTAAESDAVAPHLDDHSIQFVSYFPRLGALVAVTDDSDLLVCNVHSRAISRTGDQMRVVSPWMIWRLYLHDFADTSQWEWHASSTPGVYYLSGPSGADPGLAARPDDIFVDGRRLILETDIAYVNRWSWYYGDADSLGYSTIYLSETDYDAIHAGWRPVAATNDSDTLLIAGADGHIYRMVFDGYADLGTVQIRPTLRTSGVESSPILLQEVAVSSGAYRGAVIDLRVYTSDAVLSSTDEAAIVVPISDEVTVDAMGDVPVDLAEMVIDARYGDHKRVRLAILCNAFHLQLVVRRLLGTRMKTGGIQLTYRPMRY